MEEVPLAISINWSVSPWVITVPKADLSLDSGTKYNLTVDDYWGLLRDFADSAEAIPYPFLFTRIAATASTPSITDLDLNFYRIQFEDGLYSVNIINGNTNIRDGEVKNQVSVNTNNTTGFIDQSILVFGTFNSGIYWNAVSGKTSITDSDTDGNEANPLKNLADVLIQSINKGFSTIYVVVDATVGASDDLGGYVLEGINSSQTIITFTAGALTSETSFLNACLTGDLGGALYVKDCALLSLSGIGGASAISRFMNTAFEGGSVTIDSANSQEVHFVSCENASLSSPPILDVNGSTGNITMRQYSGSITVKGITSAMIFSFDSTGGELIIDSTNTVGTIIIRGSTVFTDSSGAGCTVIDETTSKEVWNTDEGIDVINKLSVQNKVLMNKTETDPVTGIMTVYADDDVTPLFTCNIWENVAATTPYGGNAVNRRDKLA